MKKLFFETEKDGFYGTYYENPKGSDCAVIGMFGDDPNDYMAKCGTKWLHKNGVNVLCMSPGKKNYSHVNFPLERIETAIQWLKNNGNQKITESRPPEQAGSSARDWFDNCTRRRYRCVRMDAQGAENRKARSEYRPRRGGDHGDHASGAEAARAAQEDGDHRDYRYSESRNQRYQNYDKRRFRRVRGRRGDRTAGSCRGGGDRRGAAVLGRRDDAFVPGRFAQRFPQLGSEQGPLSGHRSGERYFGQGGADLRHREGRPSDQHSGAPDAGPLALGRGDPRTAAVSEMVAGQAAQPACACEVHPAGGIPHPAVNLHRPPETVPRTVRPSEVRINNKGISFRGIPFFSMRLEL